METRVTRLDVLSSERGPSGRRQSGGETEWPRRRPSRRVLRSALRMRALLLLGEMKNVG